MHKISFARLAPVDLCVYEMKCLFFSTDKTVLDAVERRTSPNSCDFDVCYLIKKCLEFFSQMLAFSGSDSNWIGFNSVFTNVKNIVNFPGGNHFLCSEFSTNGRWLTTLCYGDSIYLFMLLQQILFPIEIRFERWCCNQFVIFMWYFLQFHRWWNNRNPSKNEINMKLTTNNDKNFINKKKYLKSSYIRPYFFINRRLCFFPSQILAFSMRFCFRSKNMQICVLVKD